MLKVLVLYYSRHGSVAEMATQVCNGIEQVAETESVLRRAPEIATTTEQTENSIPDSGPPFVNLDDLKNCSGLALGSPGRFGNMAAPLKYFLETSSSLWLAGALNGKPGTVFTATSSMHGGQESTLLSMMTPLLHHGMLITGIPYSVPELSSTTSGGTPYGASHVSGANNNQALTQDEIQICKAQGKRLAQTAHALHKAALNSQ